MTSIILQTGTSPSEMTKNTNIFPYMVAYGPKKNDRAIPHCSGEAFDSGERLKYKLKKYD